ncbi:MAG: hypothetical protein IKD72_04355 [Clostridia bacterium]|nr:hypothetical protein [Clostridia bacterium]
MHLFSMVPGFAGAEIVQKKEKPLMAYLMYVSAALTHLWAIYALQNQYWITKPCRAGALFFCFFARLRPKKQVDKPGFL